MKLSIITPTMNRCVHLSGCIESVLDASRGLDVEHIIVDNLSQDGTKELIEKYQATAPYPIVYVREPDKGIYDAMNKGIRRARGEWVHILNSDDRYMPGLRLATVLAPQVEPFDIIACGILLKHWKKGENRVWIPSYRRRLRHYNLPHPGLLIRNAFYRNHGLYSTKYRIISDAVYACDHYPDARIRMEATILVEMSSDGVSGKESLRNYREQLIMLLFHHRYPWSYKIIRAVKLLRRTSRFLLASRFPHLSSSRK